MLPLFAGFSKQCLPVEEKLVEFSPFEDVTDVAAVAKQTNLVGLCV